MSPERTWRRLLLNHLPYRTRQTAQLDPLGLPLLREAIANRVSPLRGMAVAPESIVIMCDDYRAFDVINHAALKPGSRVVVEDPCDAAVRFFLNSLGVEILPVPVGKQGLAIEKLPLSNVDMIYVSPSHQNPMGTTMSLSQRQQLLDWAAEYDVYIVECDTFGEFCYEGSPLPSLYSLDDNDRVIYVNAFSSWIGSGSKVGFAVIPRELTDRVERMMTYLSPEPSWLDQRATGEFLSSEGFFGHLRRVQEAFRRRRDTLIRAISDSFGKQRLAGKSAGRHLVWHLPARLPDAVLLREQAAEVGATLSTLNDDFCRMALSPRRPDPARVIFLGYSALSEERIQLGITRIAEKWAS